MDCIYAEHYDTITGLDGKTSFYRISRKELYCDCVGDHEGYEEYFGFLPDLGFYLILSIEARNENADTLGTDYGGYSNSDTGIKLTYADLRSNIQIDIEPYNK